ncbi:MAG: hypothetical protein WEC84_04045 [Candidatus Andersenbacteria bacterium]
MKGHFQLHIVSLLGFVLVALVMTWPAVGQLTTHVAGQGGDPWQTMWRFEHKSDLVSEAITEGNVGTFIASEFLGQTQPELVNISVWPWMGLHWLFGQPTGYNMVWLLSFVLSGYAMFLLVRSIAPKTSPLQDAGAFIAGLAYMFLPYHVAHSYGHFGAMQMQWIPFVILAALSVYRKPAVWKMLVLAALVTVQAWTEHHYFLWLILLGLGTAAVYWRHIVSNGKQVAIDNRSVLLTSILIAVAGTLLVLFSYLPTIRLAVAPQSQLNLGYEQLVRFSADPFAYIAPAAFHPVWGGLLETLYDGESGFTGNISEATQFLGFIILLVVGFFHQRIDKATKKYWCTVAVVFFVISLGPKLHLFGNVTGIPLPYELFDSLPGISSVRAVARAGALVGVAACVLFGLALSTHLRRKGFAVAVGALVLIEFLFFPVPMQSARLSQAYQQVAESEARTVVEIPAGTNYVAGSRALYASSLHGKEVLGNIALERALSEEDFALAKQLPGVRQLLLVRSTELRENRSEFFEQELVDALYDSMDYVAAEHIVLHRDSVSALHNSAIDTFLRERARLSVTDYKDVRVYAKLDSQRGDGVVLVRQFGWDHIGRDQERKSIFAEISKEATSLLINVTEQSQVVTLAFELPPENASGGSMQIDGQTVSSFESDAQSVIVEVDLEPGQHRFSIKNTGSQTLIIQNPRLAVSNI